MVGAPSILAADFARLADEVRRTRAGGAELVHFDVMDNHFVPNLSAGPAVAASLARATDLPIEVHLQVERPESLVPAFAEAGVAAVCVHPEITQHLNRTLQEIKSRGLEAGCALSPATPPSVLEYALSYLDYVNVMSVNPGFGGQAFISETAEKVRRVREMSGLPVIADDSGLVVGLSGEWPGLRRDVDTSDDLRGAADLGLGPHTRAVLARTPAP